MRAIEKIGDLEIIYFLLKSYPVNKVHRHNFALMASRIS